MNKKALVILLVLVLLGAAGVYSYHRWRDRDRSGSITLSGNIELTKVNIAFKTSGRLVQLNVDEGSPVKKGTVVARLDQDQLRHQWERSKAALAAAESQLAQLQTSIQWQQEMLQGQTEQSKAEVSQADARLREQLAGSRTQEVQQARAALDAARSEEERSRRDWERAQTLYKNEDISTSQFDQYRTRFDSAVAARKQAEERLGLVQEGPRKEDIEAARAQVARAQAGVRVSNASRLELKRRQQDMDARRADIARARADVALIESQLNDTVAASPIDGVVLVKSAEIGETLAAGTTVATVGDLDHPWLRGYVSESDLGRVKLNGKVKVTTDSFPGKVYWGRVSFISSEAEFTPKQIQTPEERVKMVYRIKIEIPNPDQELKSNMPADAVIMSDEK